MKRFELEHLIRESIQEVLTSEPDGPIGTEVEVYNGRRYYLPLFLDMFHPETHRRVGHMEFSSVKQAKLYFDRIILHNVINQYPIKIVDRKDDILFQHVPKNTPTQGDVNPSESLHEMADPVSSLSKVERNRISSAFQKAGLDGNGRFVKKEHGLSAITRILDALGFNLDVVTADSIMGDKGSRTLIFRRKNDEGQDAFTEKPEIENSRIVFNWERLDGPSHQSPNAPSRFEILAYAS